MKLTEIQKIAKKRGIKILGKFKKLELIRIIQRAEGNFDCFGTAMNYCDQLSCLWRKDCLK
jgi:hypothetical protein